MARLGQGRIFSFRTHREVFLGAKFGLFVVYTLNGVLKFVYLPPELIIPDLLEATGAILVIGYPLFVGIGYILQQNQLLNDRLTALLNRDRLTDTATRDHFYCRMAETPEQHGVSFRRIPRRRNACRGTYAGRGRKAQAGHRRRGLAGNCFGGVAVKHARAPIEAAMQAADDALYRAKRAGRNRMVIRDESVLS